MKIRKEELMSELPLTLMLMYLVYKVSRSVQKLQPNDLVLLGDDNSFFFNKYMH